MMLTYRKRTEITALSIGRVVLAIVEARGMTQIQVEQAALWFEPVGSIGPRSGYRVFGLSPQGKRLLKKSGHEEGLIESLKSILLLVNRSGEIVEILDWDNPLGRFNPVFHIIAAGFNAELEDRIGH